MAYKVHYIMEKGSPLKKYIYTPFSPFSPRPGYPLPALKFFSVNLISNVITAFEVQSGGPVRSRCGASARTQSEPGWPQD